MINHREFVSIRHSQGNKVRLRDTTINYTPSQFQVLLSIISAVNVWTQFDSEDTWAGVGIVAEDSMQALKDSSIGVVFIRTLNELFIHCTLVQESSVSFPALFIWLLMRCDLDLTTGSICSSIPLKWQYRCSSHATRPRNLNN